ncbi:site-specific integrase [uncultured Aureimonas sp.]|uniref:site-specific integrase n=1 Tax=uncultured Aureimonas sp. TaxID=1604662 RepID=UPI0025EDA9EE|nr:site-specific integrase [uncultured Aureimonas sp.]
MAKSPNYLERLSSGYYRFQMRVPKRPAGLTEFFECQQWHVQTGTTEDRLAVKIRDKMLAEHREMIAEGIRAMDEGYKTWRDYVAVRDTKPLHTFVTVPEAVFVAGLVTYHETVARDFTSELGVAPIRSSADQRMRLIAVTDGNTVSRLKEDLGSAYVDHWAPAPDFTRKRMVDALRRSGLHIDPESPHIDRHWKTFARLERASIAEREAIIIDPTRPWTALVGHVSDAKTAYQPPADPFATVSQPAVVAALPSPVESIEDVGPTITELRTDYLRTYRGDEGSRADVELYLKRFVECVGDIPIIQVKRDHVLNFFDLLAKYPARVTNAEKLMTIPQVVKSREGTDFKPFHGKTISKHYAILRPVFGQAAKLRQIPFNPFDGAEPVFDHIEDDEEVRRPFTPDELATLFSGPIYMGCAGLKPLPRATAGDIVVQDALYWSFVLGVYTGMRLEEIGALRPSDIKADAPIPYIDIREWKDGVRRRRLKNNPTKRQIPISQTLINLGFLDFARRQIDNASGQLFAELKINKKHKLTHQLSKDIGKHLTYIGLSDPTLVFHSTRHSFVDMMRAQNASDYDQRRLTGHSAGVNDTHEDYGSHDIQERWKGIVDSIVYPTIPIGEIITRSLNKTNNIKICR